MGELRWAEAVIPSDRQPDYAAAYAAASALSLDQLDFKLDEYVERLDPGTLARTDPAAAVALRSERTPSRDARRATSAARVRASQDGP